jgi:hypothetical protein
MGKTRHERFKIKFLTWLKTGRLWLGLPVFALILALFLLYQHVADSQMVGFLHDDGVYALSGQALAQGKGYTLLNVPGVPWQVKYPILYPLILSLGWLAEPRFPQNLPLLQGITIAFAVLAIPLLYAYLRQAKQTAKGLALLICLLVAANFHYMLYATSLMSEAPYFFWSLLALWLVETGEANPSRQRLAWIILVSALAFHTRTIGLTLIAAIFMTLALRKQWKNAALYLGITGLLTFIPWGVWAKLHAMPLTPLSYPLAYVYGGYGIEYGINAPHDLMSYLQAVMSKGIEPLINNFANLMLPQIAFWLGPYPLGFDLLSLGLTGLFMLTGIRALKTRNFSASGLYLAFYLLGVALWMYSNQAIRFLIMVLPWLWLSGIQCSLALGKLCLSARIKSNIPAAASGLALALTGLLLFWPSIAGYSLLYRIRSQHLIEPSGKSAPLWRDYEATFHFLQENTPASARVAGIWDPIFYLYSQRTGFGLFTSSLQPVHGQVSPASFQRLRNSMRHYQVQYIVVEPFIVNQQLQAPENPVATLLIQQFPQDFKFVYAAPAGWLRVYRFTPH